jgi:hypothetical protein
LLAVENWLSVADVPEADKIIPALPKMQPGHCCVWMPGIAHPVEVAVPRTKSAHPDRHNPESAGAGILGVPKRIPEDLLTKLRQKIEQGVVQQEEDEEEDRRLYALQTKIRGLEEALDSATAAPVLTDADRALLVEVRETLAMTQRSLTLVKTQVEMAANLLANIDRKILPAEGPLPASANGVASPIVRAIPTAVEQPISSNADRYIPPNKRKLGEVLSVLIQDRVLDKRMLATKVQAHPHDDCFVTTLRFGRRHGLLVGARKSPYSITPQGRDYWLRHYPVAERSGMLDFNQAMRGRSFRLRKNGHQETRRVIDTLVTGVVEYKWGHKASRIGSATADEWADWVRDAVEVTRYQN